MLRVDIEGDHIYSFCVHKGKKIELYDISEQRPVWSANLASLC